MAGSIGYGIWVDRDSGAFEMTVDYSIPAYIDPETGEVFSDTTWTVSYLGGGSGGWAWDSATVQLYLGFPPGEEVTDSFLTFNAWNNFSGESVGMSWHVVNAGLALQAKTLVGWDGLDIILGGRGNDLLRGLGGNDYLDAGDGNDTIEGGDGADQLRGGAGRDRMIGGAGDDYYWVDSNRDVVVEASGGGFDSVVATVSFTLSDYIEELWLDGVGLSGTGNDQANRIEAYLGANDLSGRGGDDQLYGGEGNDTLRGDDGNDLLDGGSGSNRLEGGRGDDHYVIHSAAEVIVERSGQGIDEVRVLGVASYTLGAELEQLTNISELAVFHGTGNAGANTLTGSWRIDVLDGAGGNDTLDGGMGDDVLIGGAGGDRLVGGLGTDAASYSTAAAAVTVNLGAGQGTLGDAIGDSFVSIERVIGSAFADLLVGNGAANILEGGAGNDTLRGDGGRDTIAGGAGADVLDGGADDDLVSYAASAGGVRVDLQAQTAAGGDAQGDTLASFSGVEGSGGNDTLLGSTGNDTMLGGAGVDRVDGAAGDDLVRGGAGADVLTGGTGLDTLDYLGSLAGVQVNLATLAAAGGDAQGDSIAGFERVTGSAWDDVLDGDAQANVLAGDAGADVLRGAGGNDTVLGGAGADTMDGGAGIDLVNYAGSMSWVSVFLADGRAYMDGVWDTLTGFENIRGGEVSDALYGDANANTIAGGGGGDFIDGGGGSDVLYGGTGDDAFYFGPASGTDRIMDFLPGGGWEDRVSVDMGSFYDSFDEVMAAASTSGADTVIDFGPGLRLTLVGVAKASLTPQDFVFA